VGTGRVADLLGRLVDKSLIVRTGPGGRWRMLATIRAFALEHLHGAGEAGVVRDRQLSWAAATSADLAARIGRDPDEGWRRDVDVVVADLRAALAGAPAGPGELPHRLARNLGHLSYARRFLTEALEHFRTAARHAPSPAAAAEDLRTAAQCVFVVGLAQGTYDLLLAAADTARAVAARDVESTALASALLTAYRFTSGFPRPVPASRLAELTERAERAGAGADELVAAHLAAVAAWAPGRDGEPPAPDPHRADVALEAARATGDAVLISACLDAVGAAAARAGRFRDADAVARQRHALLDRMERDRPYSAAEILDASHVAWLSALATGDPAAALAVAQAITDDDLLGAHPYRPASKLIPPLALLGRFDEVLRLAEAMWAGWRRSGNPVAAWVSPAASAVALVHGLLDNDAEHRLWQGRAGQALGGNPAIGRDVAGFAVFVEARVALHLGALDGAAALAARAFAFDVAGAGWLDSYARAAATELAVVAGLPGASRYLRAAAADAAENDWAAACLARAEGRRRGDPAAMADAVARWRRIGARREQHDTERLLAPADPGRRPAPEEERAGKDLPHRD
jgi:hypothetical protein